MKKFSQVVEKTFTNICTLENIHKTEDGEE